MKLQISLLCFGEQRICLPAAFAVLSGSKPMIEYRYDGIRFHFWRNSRFEYRIYCLMLTLRAVQYYYTLWHTTPEPNRHAFTGVYHASRTISLHCSIGSETVSLWSDGRFRVSSAFKHCQLAYSSMNSKAISKLRYDTL